MVYIMHRNEVKVNSLLGFKKGYKNITINPNKLKTDIPWDMNEYNISAKKKIVETLKHYKYCFLYLGSPNFNAI